MAKQRLYNPEHPAARRRGLYPALGAARSLLKLFAPFLPYVTEAIYQALFAADGRLPLHPSRPPGLQCDPAFEDAAALKLGETLVAAATRRAPL